TDTRPAVISPTDPLSARSAPEQPLSTPSPLEIRSTSSGASSQIHARSVPSSPVAHRSVSGPSPSGWQAQNQQVMSAGVAGRHYSPQQQSPAQSQPLEQRASGSYFPPQPENGNRSPQQQRGSETRPSPAQQAPRPQHQQGPPRPPKQPVSQPQPQVAPQPTPLHDSSMGHFLDPITEQPDLEDAASIARKASLASQASRSSSHRHSMPALPTARNSLQNHIASPTQAARAPPSTPQLGHHPHNGVAAHPNLPQRPPQPRPRTMAPPIRPQQPPQNIPQQPGFQPSPVLGMYTDPGTSFYAEPPAGKPAAQADEKRKSKWLSKLLKSSRPSQKASPPPQQQQQYMWPGLVQPSQSPAPGAPWSPGSVGNQMAFPPPGAAPMQQAVPPVDGGQMHQRQGSVGAHMAPVSIGQQGLGLGRSAHAHTKSVPLQTAQPNYAHPLQSNPVTQAEYQSQPRPATSHSGQTIVPAGPPPSAEQAQLPEDSGPARSESVRSDLTFSSTRGIWPSRSESMRSDFTSVSAAHPRRSESVRSESRPISGAGPFRNDSVRSSGAGPFRNDSVRSDFTTISTSEAQVQHVLKPQLVQVSRTQRSPQQTNGYTSSPAPSAPQIRYSPPQGAADVAPNGYPPQKHDNLRVAPLQLRDRLSAEDVDGVEGRESMISDVSSVESADSRRVSNFSGPARPRGRPAIKGGDYSGSGWGDDA
ncbi:hypothetical protein IMZ48_43105, partial [Candidatus Bathyarchaeota archaeon]|nr:hypothetical protein [Candidatus Bathyarchaeota archaeon]